METEIVKLFNHWGAGWIDFVMILVSSNILLGIIGIIMTIFFLVYNKKNGRQIVVATVVAISLHFLISEIFFKYILPEFGLFRLRPYLAYPGEIIGLGEPNTSSSFPSSHMAYTLSLLTVYVYYYRKFWPMALGLAIIMAYARMHNGMHYPSDIVAGAGLGIIYAFMAIKFSKNLKIKEIE